MRHRNEEALSSVAKLRRLANNDKRVQLGYKSIILEVRIQQALQKHNHPHSSEIMLKAYSWLDLFRPRYFKHTLISCVMPYFSNLVT